MEQERDNGERGLTTIGNASFSAADDGVEGEEDTMELSLSSGERGGAGDVHGVLHEPLFPIEWTPPPASPPRPPRRHFRLSAMSAV
uniref:Uncharacterized protein n=1 Tax=Oryza barthii TaxID=65489 RepID=A0A0D3G5W4_9ORYZ